MDRSQILKIAKLSRLELTDEQCERFGKEMTAIVDWFAKLQEVDTNGVAPMTGVGQKAAPRRDDKATDGNLSEALMACAPKSCYGYYAVPKVVE